MEVAQGKSLASLEDSSALQSSAAAGLALPLGTSTALAAPSNVSSGQIGMGFVEAPAIFKRKGICKSPSGWKGSLDPVMRNC